MATHNDLGLLGEDVAIDYLIKHGYQILERNYRYQKGEVDILAKKDDALVAVEVKTRTGNYFGDPHEFVKPKKIKLLVATVDHYVTQHDLDVEVRFDIIGIVHAENQFKIEHIEDAFLHF